MRESPDSDQDQSSYRANVRPRGRERLTGRGATAAIWLVSCAVVGIAGVIAGLLLTMATSMDPTEMVTAGLEPWTDAAYAGAGFVGLCLVTALALGLWHSRRFWIVGLALTALDIGAVAWLGLWMAREYF